MAGAGGQMDNIMLVQSQFDDLVAQHGKTVTWQAGYQCSCINIAAGSMAPNQSCKACGGTGYVYQPPISDKIIMTGIDLHRQFLPAGSWQTGDITATIPNLKPVYTEGATGNLVSYVSHPFWYMGEGDIVYLNDSEQRSTVVLTHGQNLWRLVADTLPYPATVIQKVMTLFVSDPASGNVTYFTPGVEGTDYTVSGGVVTWVTTSTADYMLNGNVIVFNPNGTNAKGLTTGAQYSVVYTHYPTYIVYMDLPEPRDQDGQHMPRKVMLRLKNPGAP